MFVSVCVCGFVTSVEGGELFNRIVDDNYQLTELDAIVFTRQICEGVQYLHQQYILHLDLKVKHWALDAFTAWNKLQLKSDVSVRLKQWA